MNQGGKHVVEISFLLFVDHDSHGVLEVHRRLIAQVEQHDLPYECIYLLNAPPTAVTEEVLSLREEDPLHVRVLRFQGLVRTAGQLAAGVDRAHGDWLITLSSRLENEMNAIGVLIRAVRGDADVVFVSRNATPGGGVARWESRVFNRLVSWLTATPFTDVASGVRAIRREVLEEVPLYGDFHRYLPVLAHNAGFRVQEIPLEKAARGRSPGLHSPRIYLWRAMDLLSIFFLSRFTRRPLRLFGAIGSLFGVMGAVILAVIGMQRLMGVGLAQRPILVLGTLLVGLGMQALTIGLLGELLLFFHARNIREYRIANIYEAEEPPLPPEPPDPGSPKSPS